MSKNERSFNISDAELIQHGENVAVNLPDDIEQFTAFDSTISSDYPVGIQAAIGEVKGVKSDKVVIDEQAELTQNLNAQMSSCNMAFRTIAFFVRKAFSDNRAVQNQFGFNDIAAARNNQPKMILFMESLAGTANKYREKLIAKGCNVAVIDSLPILAEGLKNANTEQEVFKKGRGIMTQDRVGFLNVLYSFLKPISEIAQIIFADDPARLAKYTLPKPKSSTDSADDLLTS